MSFSFVLLLFFITTIILSCFLILSLNTSIVYIDLLFYELDIGLGLALLTSFLIGLFITICFEILYFLKKRGNGNE
tara:strand:- start:148 stop:375 length:228 start_codon:yes stop_codon:yes gene_type:complete